MFESEKKYPIVKLSDVCDIAKGQQVNADQLSESGAFPCYNGGIEPSGYWHEFNTIGNSISISEGGNSCGFVNFQQENYWCGAHCYHLDNVTCDVYFLYCQLKVHQEIIMGLRSGSCLPNIKKSTIQNYPVIIPPLEEQTRFSAFAQESDKSKFELLEAISRIDKLIKSLIQQENE